MKNTFVTDVLQGEDYITMFNALHKTGHFNFSLEELVIYGTNRKDMMQELVGIKTEHDIPFFIIGDGENYCPKILLKKADGTVIDDVKVSDLR